MNWTLDARIPLRFGARADAGPADALLLEGEGPAATDPPTAWFQLAGTDHPPGCTCCLPRSPVALALHDLFQARAKGELPFFHGVLVIVRTTEGQAAVAKAVRSDPLLSGRFRQDDSSH
ncbi:MAG: hypothetical protein NVSMB18_21200 [Acetobacteraceae bacterium]